MALPSGGLAIAVASVSLMIIGLAVAGIAIEMRSLRHKFEIERIQFLADATVEGLVVCEGQTIIMVNESFAVLAGLSAESAVGMSLKQFLPEETTRLKLVECANQPTECDLLQADGLRIPVKLIMRPINFSGKPRNVIAVRDIRMRKQAEEHIRYLAHYDALTGISNRSSFNEKLEVEIQSALATGQRLAVLCLNLDRFKKVNDLFGQAAGDKVLQFVAKQIQSTLDSSRTIARLGGDEFAIIAPGVASPAAASRIAERILEVLQVTSLDPDIPAPISSSIGIAICPDDATSRSELLACADTALNRAKSDGRGTYRFFETLRDRCQIEHDLHQAAP